MTWLSLGCKKIQLEYFGHYQFHCNPHACDWGRKSAILRFRRHLYVASPRRHTEEMVTHAAETHLQGNDYKRMTIICRSE